MCKVICNPNVDHIFCLRYSDMRAVETNFQPFEYQFEFRFQPLEVTDTIVSCNLNQRQRSSQQILDLADYLEMHRSYIYNAIRRWDSAMSFSSTIPIWVEIAISKSFFAYFKDIFESNDDVMLIWNYNNKPSNWNKIQQFCREQKWRCTASGNVQGSEASVTILYDLDEPHYEYLTRAKTHLIIVTIKGKKRYPILYQNWFVSKNVSF